MKIFEKITLLIYSNIILISAVILILMLIGVLDTELVSLVINRITEGDTSKAIVIGINILFILFSIKCIFFDKNSKRQINESQGVILENESGKLLISRETIENLVNSVAINFESTEDVTTRIEVNKENQVRVFINLVVSSNVIIKELSANLQNKIKEKVKIATDLEVKEVNINIKRVAQKKDLVSE